jgi:hypothetical protein
MSETAVAVEAVVEEAFSPPTEVAPQIVRREDVREQIMNGPVELDGEVVEAGTDDAGVTIDTDSGSETEQNEDSTDAELDSSEPPPEAVIGEGGNRVVVRTPDGKFAPAPEVKLEFQVGDKTYLKSPAELVRMARDGVAGQQFAQEVKQYREHLPVVAQRIESLERELEAQAALNRELLEDESSYYERRQQWERMNSPEERLRQIESEREQQLLQQRASYETAQRQQAIASYYMQEIKPVQDTVLNGFPQVSMEAKMGRIAIDTAPLLVNGVIPPQRLPELKAYLAGPFRDWVQSEAARVDQKMASLAAQVDQSRKKAQQAVQSVGRQLAPNGRPAPDAAPPPRKPRTREEAKQMILNRPWQE